MSDQEIIENARKLSGLSLHQYLDEACAGNPDQLKRIKQQLRIWDTAETELREPPTVEGDVSLAADSNSDSNNSGSIFDQPTKQIVVGSLNDGADSKLETARGKSNPTVARNSNTNGEELKPNDWIGRYQLVRPLGEGGMGAVWEAQQNEPVKRRVAVKLIRDGLGSDEILARFEAERQALALMSHPNIAAIIDADTAPDGRPYFAMELVEGVPLTHHCDQNKLTVQERIKLFTDVCAGVQHAHQKGILHRDLKPSNILVSMIDGCAVPKVIDFGLAKAFESDLSLTDKTMATGVGRILGTLKYMSPEQASLDCVDIDTRTDIFSLGVVLYELLTGTTPLDGTTLKVETPLRVLEIIRDEEPVKPSSSLSSYNDQEHSAVTSQRRTSRSQLTRVLAGDLDWVVMKALEKDRDRRYESASELANDVQRFLDGEPVSARSPTFGYQLGKFVRRNKTGVVAAGLVALALIGGIFGTSWGLVRAVAAEREAVAAQKAESERAENERLAKLEAEKQTKLAKQALQFAESETAAKDEALKRESAERKFAEAVSDFVENDFLLLMSVDGQNKYVVDENRESLNKDSTLADLLDWAGEKLMARTDLAPRTAGRLYSIVGKSYARNGLAKKGMPFLQRSLELNRLAFGDSHETTASSVHDLASLYQSAGNIEKTQTLIRQAIKLRSELLGPASVETLSSRAVFAQCLLDQGKFKEAISTLEEAVERAKTSLGMELETTWHLMDLLGHAYSADGQFRESIETIEPVYQRRRERYGRDALVTLISANRLASVYGDVGRTEEATKLFEETLGGFKIAYGEYHPNTLSVLNNLCQVYMHSGHESKAIEGAQTVLNYRIEILGENHPDVLLAMNSLATLYCRAGQLDKGIPIWESAIVKMNEYMGSEHPRTILVNANLASALVQLESFEQAIPLLNRCLEVQLKTVGRKHPATLRSLHSLGVAYVQTGDFKAGIELLDEVVDVTTRLFGPRHQLSIKASRELALAFIDFPNEPRNPERAVVLLESLSASRDLQGPNSRVDEWLRHAYGLAGQKDKLLELAPKTLVEIRNTRQPKSLPLASDLAWIGLDYLEIEEFDSAQPFFEEALKIRQAQIPDDWKTCNMRCLIGACLLGKGQHGEAAKMLESGYVDLVDAIIPKERRKRQLFNAVDWLIESHQALQDSEEVKKWQAERERLEAEADLTF